MYQALYRKYRSQTFGQLVGLAGSSDPSAARLLSKGKSAMPIFFGSTEQENQVGKIFASYELSQPKGW